MLNTRVRIVLFVDDSAAFGAGEVSQISDGWALASAYFPIPLPEEWLLRN